MYSTSLHLLFSSDYTILYFYSLIQPILYSKRLRMHKNSFVNIVDTVLYFNLFALAAFTLYYFKVNPTKQTAACGLYISAITTSILFIESMLPQLQDTVDPRVHISCMNLFMMSMINVLCTTSLTTTIALLAQSMQHYFHVIFLTGNKTFDHIKVIFLIRFLYSI